MLFSTVDGYRHVVKTVPPHGDVGISMLAEVGIVDRVGELP